MSSIFKGTPSPAKRIAQQQLEPIETVTQDASEAGRARRKKLAQGGAPSTRISGIRSALGIALKRRLGE